METFLVIGDPHFRLDNNQATTQLENVLVDHLRVQ